MNKFYNPPPLDRTEALAAFARGDKDALCDAIIAVALHDPDWRWVQAVCLKFVIHESSEVRGAAAIGLGHIARIHHQLDLALVLPILQSLNRDVEVRGRAGDALEDIETFITRYGAAGN